ncbi:hypothetical protein HZH66_009151 [Vespula vulgaris]|uniref:Uncharacterized protein n=1 Tax=Vespula vulgaris TaxID=7454 RepID=A0A834N3W1_VESVU|nr:hypothetical protein HZH66_009151 [Vespula vulgaris]
MPPIGADLYKRRRSKRTRGEVIRRREKDCSLLSSHGLHTFASFHLTSPHFTLPYHASPHLISPYLASPHLTSPHLTSPHLTSHHLTAFCHILPLVLFFTQL